MKLTPAYISSTIPDASSCRALSLRSKSITHIDDISFCVNLVRLDLGENEMRSGEALSGVKYCKGITWISVAKNHLKDISHLTDLKNLQVLNASYNELSELPWDALADLKCLKALILNNNNFTLFPPTACLPKSIDTLVLSHNPLQDLPDKLFKGTPQLTKLSCSHAELHRVPDLSKCPELKEIRLASNKIGSLAEIEKRLPLTVEIIDIGQNLIRKPAELEKLFKFKKLNSLNIRGNLTNEEEEQEFFRLAQKELPLLTNFNGRSLQPAKKKRNATEFRLKPERQNKNTKVTFKDEE